MQQPLYHIRSVRSFTSDDDTGSTEIKFLCLAEWLITSGAVISSPRTGNIIALHTLNNSIKQFELKIYPLKREIMSFEGHVAIRIQMVTDTL